MQRMRSVFVKLGLLPVLVMEVGACCPARGDLIRPSISRSYPDIAGDLVGSQTYTFDPNSKTGYLPGRQRPSVHRPGTDGERHAERDARQGRHAQPVASASARPERPDWCRPRTTGSSSMAAW